MKIDLRQPPAAMAISWQPKPVSSAKSGVRTLEDGRTQAWIEHALVRGVTPAMLLWWFQNIEGDMLYQGQRVPRYRVWHPVDHVRFYYAKRLPNGGIGAGSVFHITEMFGARPDYLIDVDTDVVRLDETGFAHLPRRFGVRAARMDYDFAPEPGGTRYVNSLTVGIPGRRVINGLIRRFMFDDDRARAWIKHNIEEVGQFEAFLPELFAQASA